MRPDPADPADPSKWEWYCFACSFRPWADTGNAVKAVVTVVHLDGSKERIRATQQGDRWVVTKQLAPGESAYVGAGDVKDAFGNANGAPTSTVSG